MFINLCITLKEQNGINCRRWIDNEAQVGGKVYKAPSKNHGFRFLTQESIFKPETNNFVTTACMSFKIK